MGVSGGFWLVLVVRCCAVCVCLCLPDLDLTFFFSSFAPMERLWVV